MSFKKHCTISSSYEFQARTSSIPKEDVVFPRMLYCDSRCSRTLPGLSRALPGALLCNATRRLGDRKRVILRRRIRGSVKAVRAIRNTRVFQTETRVVADGAPALTSHCIYVSISLDLSCPIVFDRSVEPILLFISVASGSVFWAAWITCRRSLNRSTVVTTRVGTSHAVALSEPSTSSGRLDRLSAGSMFPSKCWIMKLDDNRISAHLACLRVTTFAVWEYSRFL